MGDAAQLRARIEAKLRERLAARHVEVHDESHLHRGHVGAAGGGGHFRVTIVSERFEGLSLQRSQRLVYEVLSEEMKGEIHALAMKTMTPSQWDELQKSQGGVSGGDAATDSRSTKSPGEG